VAAALAYLSGEEDGAWEAAEQELRRLAYRPESRMSGDAWRWLALVYDRLNRPADVATACRRALQFNPHSRELGELLNRVDPPASGLDEDLPTLRVGKRVATSYDPVQKRVTGRLTRGDPYGALDVCRNYLRRLPRTPGGWDDVARIYSHVRQYPLATAAVERARKLHPSRLEYQYALGVYLTYAERYAEAEHVVQGGLAQDAGYEGLYLAQASILAHRGQRREALQWLKRYTQAMPFSVEGWLRLGDAHLDLQEYDDADAAYRNALRWEPQSPNILRSLARLHARREDQERALKYYLQASQHESGGGVVFTEMRRFVNAHGLYTSLIDAVDVLLQERQTRPSRLYAGRANALLMLGRYEEAEQDYGRALELVLPEDRFWVLMSRGLLHLLRGRDDAAVVDLEESMRLGETLQYPGLWLWIVHVRNGRLAEAHKAVTEALDRGEWDLHATRLLRYYLDEVDQDVLVSLARDKEQQCEAFFYVGARAMVEGREGESYDWYWKCAQTLVTEFVEYTMAVYYLRQARDEGRWTMPEGGPSPTTTEAATK
jgi:tetratricopeptide (TPR) repeat protein